ncbi:hypothetical protein [Noviherbaspirillum pedocola]|uniref:Uncharacterized protein n=1 Tax=Noviherbaspirillum pedocola TaxID=2801341 RepID=A0A934SVK8_9BURK|nr:hypothetical protein [Noviherbaspirillum pedocola]MBK4736158.1 hypothetical protein [Noviherbaspirillum pedocola]
MNPPVNWLNVATDVIYAVVAISAVVYLATFRKPQHANFRLFTKRSFVAFMFADSLIYGTTYLAERGLPVGTARQMLVIIGAGVAICIGMAVLNVRKTNAVFGLAATVMQATLYGVAFPLMLAWMGYRLLSTVLLNGPVRSYSEDERERFEISDDELLKRNLYAPDRMDPGIERTGL